MELERLLIVIVSASLLMIGILVISRFLKDDFSNEQDKNKKDEAIRFFIEEYVKKKNY